MASLAASLLEAPLDPAVKDAVLCALWDLPLFPQSPCVDEAALDAYWEFYLRECSHALHDAGRHVSARTHQDIVDTAALLKQHRTRHEIRDTLRPKLSKACANEDQILDNSIDLAARLLLMLDFGNLPYGFSGRRQLHWVHDSVESYVQSYFSSSLKLGHERVKLEKVFNARNLYRIAGVQLVPTDNLADHLRLTDDDTKLYIFHHASFLKLQPCSPILPPGLADETLRTLALLFPQTDASTRKYFYKLPCRLSLDPQLIQCGHLKTDDRQLENFNFWRDRLVILKQVFDEATPRTIAQWWHDRRNGVQWYTFWVAILVLAFTLFFGFIQCIEGALQVYGTFHPSG